MIRSLIRALKMVLWMTCITGLVYPMIITSIAQLTMPLRAQGSFTTVNNKNVGSLLIAQSFTDDRYFWPRPSAVNFNPLPSGGSNLGPTSAELKKIVKERQEHLSKAHGTENLADIPSDLLYASGSGLDPHINIETAYFQFNRVADARRMNEEDKQALRKTILRLSHSSFVRFLGNPRVNVLELNKALDELRPMP